VHYFTISDGSSKTTSPAGLPSAALAEETTLSSIWYSLLARVLYSCSQASEHTVCRHWCKRSNTAGSNKLTQASSRKQRVAMPRAAHGAGWRKSRNFCPTPSLYVVSSNVLCESAPNLQAPQHRSAYVVSAASCDDFCAKSSCHTSFESTNECID